MSQKKKVRFKILAAPDDLSEIKNKVKKFRFRKLRKLLVPAVLILLAVCGTYLLLDNQTYARARTAAEYPSDLTDMSSYARFADGIVRYNRDGVVLLNKKNEEQWIQPAQIQNPVIRVKDETFAVADNGGNNILVFTREGLRGEIQTNLPIEKIAVSEQGIVSAVLRNEDSPMIISYDATGNILVEQQVTVSALGYPLAMEMSDDGNMLAVAYLYTEGAAMKSKVIYYNFGETGQERTDNIVLSEEYDGTVMADIFFMGDDRSVVVGDNRFVIYRGREIPEKEKEIELDQEIQSVFHSDRYIGFILLNQEKSGYELRLYNRLGEQVLSRDISGKYSNVQIDGNEIIMFEGSRCCIMTAFGIIKFEGDVNVEALEIFRAPGISRYYMMSVDGLRVIYLTK